MRVCVWDRERETQSICLCVKHIALSDAIFPEPDVTATVFGGFSLQTEDCLQTGASLIINNSLNTVTDAQK